MTKHWLNLTWFLIFLTSGCGGGGNSSNNNATVPTPIIPPPTQQETGLLVPADTNSILLTSIRSGFQEVLDQNAESRALAETSDDSSTTSSAETYTTTYNLEAGIDEHDYIQYDGSHIYIAPTRGLDCCFVIEDRAVSTEETNENSTLSSTENAGAIRIMSTDPSTAGVSELTTIPLPDDRTVEGLYIYEKNLITIDSTGWWGIWGQRFADPLTWTKQSVGMQIHNVSDPSTPNKDWTLEIEGGFVNSRRVGENVYLVVRHTPAIPGLIYYPDNDEERTSNETLLEALTLDQVLPEILINGSESSYLGPQDCWITDTNHPLAGDQLGFPTLTIILSIDVTAAQINKATCYNESTDGIYVSPQAVYLTQKEYDENGKFNTLIHQFPFSTGITYGGSGRVNGTLSGGQNADFRINEFNGYLRLITTQWTGIDTDRWEHKLHILRRDSTTPSLNTISTLPNEERPVAIGKPNEDLYGVRFLENTLYLVTYERIDPLYVLDLSNPLDPTIKGELEVTGFSDFLHPIGNSLLLGLGQDDSGSVKIELFNVSALNAPYSLGAFTFGKEAQWAFSEARYDRHAFTYLADIESTDRFTLPVTLDYWENGLDFRREHQLHLLEIQGKDTPASASIKNIGHISADNHPNDPWGSTRSRSVIHNNAVYFVSDQHVWSAMWTDPYNQSGPH